jgi:hypothetical protein
MKIKSILLIIILIAALAGAGFLVKNNQETRSGASFANVEAIFLPSEKTLKIGEKLTTTLMIDTKDRLLTGADLKVKYEQSVLELESVEKVSNGLDEMMVSNIYQGAGIYEFVAVNTGKETSRLSKGVVNLVKLNFVAIANGQAKVSLDTSYGNMVTGYNEAGSDQELKVDKISSAIYTIAGIEARNTQAPREIECSWCGEACIETSEKESFACPDVIPVGKKCVSQNGQCVVVEGAATE